MARKIVIKRYGNRRLYNSETRSYVKLQDIAGFIREGAEIQVLDSRTGEDITKLVLTQIILEEEKSKKDLLPLNFLYDLIRHQQGWVQEFFQRHVVRALEGVLPKQRSELLPKLRQSFDFRVPSNSFLDRLLHRSDAAGLPVKAGETAVVASASAELEPANGAPPPAPPMAAEEALDELALLASGGSALDELLNRLEAIESRMNRLEKGLPKDEPGAED